MLTLGGCVPLCRVSHHDLPLDAYLPRTRSFIIIRDAGLPVLDGCLFLTCDEENFVKARLIMREFTTVLVRSDPLQIGLPSIRGGDIWPLEKLDECAALYCAAGRVLMLFEPYERTMNKWSFSILIDRVARSWFLEVVGAGFDCGHLNRGRVTPHEMFSGRITRTGLEIESHTPFDVARFQEESKKFRLPVKDAVPLPEAVLSKILTSTINLLSKYLPNLFVLSGAVLDPGERFVFWDLFDSTQLGR